MSFITDIIYNRMAAVLSEAKGQGRCSVPDAFTPMAPDEDAALNMIFLGDPQISNYMHARQRTFMLAADDISKSQGVFDVAALLGDVAENGFICEYRLAADIVNSFSGKVKNVIAVPGNHDLRMRFYHRQKKVFTDFIKSMRGGIVPTGKHYYFSTRINGYKFIMMGADMSSFEACHLSKKQLDFVDREIAEENGRPVFIFNHQTFKKHNGLPDVWQSRDNHRGSIGRQSDALREIFLKYKNIFFITGHLHDGAFDKSFEDYGAYKSVSVPTCGASNHGEYGTIPQFITMSVYDDRVVLRNRASALGRFTDENHPGGYAEYPIDK